jgi:hypothetical protein
MLSLNQTQNNGTVTAFGSTEFGQTVVPQAAKSGVVAIATGRGDHALAISTSSVPSPSPTPSITATPLAALAGSGGMTQLWTGSADDAYLAFTIPFSFRLFNVRHGWGAAAALALPPFPSLRRRPFRPCDAALAAAPPAKRKPLPSPFPH